MKASSFKSLGNHSMLPALLVRIRVAEITLDPHLPTTACFKGAVHLKSLAKISTGYFDLNGAGLQEAAKVMGIL